jgi:hypothetical protein
MSCKGYQISTSDGEDFDCEYEFAGEFGCEDCMYGPYPDQFSMDPTTGKRVSLKKWEKEMLHYKPEPKEHEFQIDFIKLT